jgi:formate dehydrogenase maturation protein FdhE
LSTALIVNDEMERKTQSFVERAEHVEITDQMTYNVAVRFLDEVTALETEIIKHHEPMKKSAHKTWKEICSGEKKLLDPVQNAKTTIRRVIATWIDEQERIRKEEERKALEVLRLQEEKLREEMAEQAEKLGADEQSIEEIRMTPIPLPRPVITPTFQKASGISTRETWKVEVDDVRKLCRGIADGTVSPTLVEPNMTALNGLARSLKNTFNIPGCRVVRDAGLNNRR